MEKMFIRNRQNKKIALNIQKPNNPEGLVFVMHGLGSDKDFPHIISIASSFIKNNFIVISFDARNANGDSEGLIEDASVTSYYEDLEDVIKWAQTQAWFQEPFYLAGLSVGALCVTLFTQKNRRLVKALAPISLVVSGELLFKSWGEEHLEKWRQTGIREWESRYRKGLTNRIKYDFVADAQKYDLLLEMEKLDLPVLMIVGSNDTTTPVEHQKLFFDKLPGPKEFHIIKDAGHSFSGGNYLQKIEAILDKWIKSIN